jgi:hypothetical protein
MEGAIASYYEAIGVTFRVLRDANLSTTEKASYRSMVKPLYQELAALLQRQGRVDDARSIMEQLAG